jgi:hypothetical protein
LIFLLCLEFGTKACRARRRRSKTAHLRKGVWTKEIFEKFTNFLLEFFTDVK